MTTMTVDDDDCNDDEADWRGWVDSKIDALAMIAWRCHIDLNGDPMLMLLPLICRH